MEIKINGTIRIEEKANFDSPADNRNTQEIPAPIDHNKDVLLDNATTFKELLRVLARNPEVVTAAKLEAEEQEREEREAKLREALGEDYDLVIEKKEERNMPKRRPGSRQLRQGYPRVAMIEIGKSARLEVFNNAYAIYDNGNRRVVLWVPECGSATYYFTGLRDNEKEYLSQKEEIGMDVLGDLPWYHALMIAGENRIEYNMDHPKSKGNTSEFDVGDDDAVPASHWAGASRFDTPEEAYLKKEAAEERWKALTEKQRQVFMMRYMSGMTQQKIAERMGVSQVAVQRILERISQRIKKLMKGGYNLAFPKPNK